MFRAIAKPIVPPAPSTATVSAVRAAGRVAPARAGRAAGVPRCAICDSPLLPRCGYPGRVTATPRGRPDSSSGGALGQAGQVGGADVVVRHRLRLGPQVGQVERATLESGSRPGT